MSGFAGHKETHNICLIWAKEEQDLLLYYVSEQFPAWVGKLMIRVSVNKYDNNNNSLINHLLCGRHCSMS